MFRTILIIALIGICNICNAGQHLSEIEIAGKICDQDGNLITDEVILTVELESWTYPDVWKPGAKSLEEQIITDTTNLEKKIYGGTFSWKLPDANTCDIKASMNGYHGDWIILHEDNNDKMIVKDMIIHLVKKGTPSKLEYVHEAHIPDKEDKGSNGKDCGWSFKRLWYFPVSEEETVWMTRSYDGEGRAVYTMKEPGGFVCFPGYPLRESEPDKKEAKFDWMPEAPEEGYVQSVCPKATGYYYYCRTPDGKYGKIELIWGFSYYLQPDGSRNLEAGEVVRTGPVRPEYRKRLEKEQRGY
ncbi:MAG: hypothetical protein PHO67_03115 [Candidatus Omnitrophica bacterium]|nr:hypothetical protein [Candidatus Omnitrophota bacterium]MDD5546139.1 hypothetical protein [Candidatus Omnitrophota bacterium]